MTIRDAFPDIIATDDDDSIISRYTDAHDNELEEIEGELDEILVTFQLRQIDLYGQRPDSAYSITYIDTDGNEQTLEVTDFSLVEDIPDVDEVISVFDDDREYILDGDYKLFFIDGELEGIEWTPDNNNPSLDRIGQLFGEIGRRRGRDDREYRRFLNSLVPVLSGRGQVPTLKEAVAISLSMDAESIGVEENFEELEFEIILSDFWEPHQGSAIESIVDRARPSGVEHVSTRYQVPDEELLGATAIATTDGQQVLVEAESSSDVVLVGIRITETFEDTTAQDIVTAADNDRETLEQFLSNTLVTEDVDVEVWTTTSSGQDVPYVPTEADDLSEDYVEDVVFEETASTDSTTQNIQQNVDDSTDTLDLVTEDIDVEVWTTTSWDVNRWDESDWDQNVPYVPLKTRVEQETNINDENVDELFSDVSVDETVSDDTADEASSSSLVAESINIVYTEQGDTFDAVDEIVKQDITNDTVSGDETEDDISLSVDDSIDTLDLVALVTEDVTLILDVNNTQTTDTVAETVDQPLSADVNTTDDIQAENFNNAWDLGNYDESLWA